MDPGEELEALYYDPDDPGSYLERGRELGAVADRRRLDFLRYTQPQRQFLSDISAIALWRDGNQVGKSVATIAETIHRCRGTHPYKTTHRPPINVVLLSESWDQMGTVGGFLEKLWEYLPKDEIDPRVRLDRGRGITGKPPRIPFVRGPGRGSAISLATFHQGASRLAGPTVHFIATDEPPPPSLVIEILPRLLRHRGQLRINFTPTLDMPSQEHLRKLCTAAVPGRAADPARVSEHNYHLKAINCWPVGNPFPWLPQSDIDTMAKTLPEAVRRMRIEGSWEPVLTHRWLTNYAVERHKREGRPPAGAYLGVGIDHGEAAGKQAAVLFAATGRAALRPYVWFLDEAISDGFSTVAQDADAILEMLKRNGFAWSDIDQWIGDRPTGAARFTVTKSNTRLRQHLAYQTKVPVGRWKRFHVPYKFGTSVEHGLWLWNTLLGDADDDGTPHCFIDPRCVRLHQFCAEFVGDRRDPLKDVGDAGRYILELAIKEVPGMKLVARY